ncbi:MAG TPA: transcription elongation factor GreA [Bryobacterales bacterium]|nr:transcription elongation factor GreA [Bryobacterales bacterium]
MAAAKILQKLEEQIRALEYELHNELPREIKIAREYGDLSENAEYKAAKERQEIVRARLGMLQKRLAEFSMIDFSKIPRDSAGLGSTVVLYDLKTESEISYRLVTSEEADAANGAISTTSPIGRGVLGKKVGDVVQIRTPAGAKEFEILRLTTIHDEE